MTAAPDFTGRPTTWFPLNDGDTIRFRYWYERGLIARPQSVQSEVTAAVTARGDGTVTMHVADVDIDQDHPDDWTGNMTDDPRALSRWIAERVDGTSHAHRGDPKTVTYNGVEYPFPVRVPAQRHGTAEEWNTAHPDRQIGWASEHGWIAYDWDTDTWYGDLELDAIEGGMAHGAAPVVNHHPFRGPHGPSLIIPTRCEP